MAKAKKSEKAEKGTKKAITNENVLLTLRNLSSQFKGLGDGEETTLDTYRSSGSVILDEVVSGGKGIPRKKFIQLTSPANTGKSTLMLHACRTACASGEHCVYLDVEKGVNDSQIEGIGLKKYLGTSFFLYKISTFEECETILEASLQDSAMAYIVIDSITALMSEESLEKSVTDVLPASEARINSLFLKKWKARLEMSACTADFVFINQQRTKLNFRGVSSIVEAGGEAQRFYMDIRLRMRVAEKLEKAVDTVEGNVRVPYGANVEISAPEKNRFNQPNVVGVVTILFGKGVSNISAYQRYLTSLGAITQNGAFYYLKLPEQEEPIKCHGQYVLTKVLQEKMPIVHKFIMDNGGFKLIHRKDESEELEIDE